MSTFPFWVNADDTLVRATEIIEQKRIHHLPVKDEGKLWGIISDRDIQRAEAVNKGERALLVRDVAVSPPLIVDINERLDNVLLKMINERVGSVVVTKGDQLAGVFTQYDVASVFIEWIRYETSASGGDGDDVA